MSFTKTLCKALNFPVPDDKLKPFEYFGRCGMCGGIEGRADGSHYLETIASQRLSYSIDCHIILQKSLPDKPISRQGLFTLFLLKITCL